MFGSGSSTFSNTIEVIDPCNRTGKITVPKNQIQDTRGIQLWRDALAAKRSEGRTVKMIDLSLCLLFQKGKCNAGIRCNQVHADPSFIAELRQKASNVNNCCAMHGDVHSQSLKTNAMTVFVENDANKIAYSIQSCASTKALDYFTRQAIRNHESNVTVPSTKICRLHAQNRCKFGRDCKNVHVCHKAVPVKQEMQPMRSIATVSERPDKISANASVDTIPHDSTVLSQSSVETSPEEKPMLNVDVAPPLSGWKTANPLSVSDAWDFNVVSMSSANQQSGSVTSGSSMCIPLDAEECSFSHRDMEAFVADLTACQPSPVFVSPTWH